MRRVFVALMLFVSSRAFATGPRCDIALLEKVNYSVSRALICASLPKDRIEDCLVGLARYGGFAAVIGSTFIKMPEPDFSKVERTLLRDAAGHLKTFRESGLRGRIKSARLLIVELSKHKRLYYHQLISLRIWLLRARVFHYMGALGMLSVPASYIAETFMTSPSDCEKLKFERLEKQDNQYVDFGLNCSKYMKSDFFKLAIEKQTAILDRSPALCDEVSKYGKLVE